MKKISSETGYSYCFPFPYTPLFWDVEKNRSENGEENYLLNNNYFENGRIV